MSDSDIKVAIFQVTMTHYRVPIFGILSERLPYKVEVIFGRPPEEQHLHAPPQPWPFPNQYRKMWKLRFWNHSPLYIQWREIWAAIGWNYQVLVLTADFHILSYPIASLLARLRGKAVIHWTHGTSLGGPKSPRKERIRRWIHKHLSHALLLYGSRERSYYISEGYCENDIFLTNNSLDTRQTIAIRDSVLPHETDDYRRRVGGRGPYFAYVGRLIKSKRVDLLIRAVPKMSEHYPGIRIVIIGDGPERVSLMELAKELDVLQHVVFEGPVYDDRQLAPMLLACDACVCPGSVGLIVNQAFVFGLPIVTSDDPWVHSPEIAMLESGVNGLRFNDGSAESLADALLRLVSCRQSLAAMKQAAMDTISNKYNENAVVTGFKDAIESACTKAGLLRRGSGHRRR